jgi:hypothetical protein
MPRVKTRKVVGHGRSVNRSGSPPPCSPQGRSRWTALPPANRRRLVWLLSQLLERHLNRYRVAEQEDSHEADAEGQ